MSALKLSSTQNPFLRRVLIVVFLFAIVSSFLIKIVSVLVVANLTVAGNLQHYDFTIICMKGHFIRVSVFLDCTDPSSLLFGTSVLWLGVFLNYWFSNGQTLGIKIWNECFLGEILIAFPVLCSEHFQIMSYVLRDSQWSFADF